MKNKHKEEELLRSVGNDNKNQNDFPKVFKKYYENFYTVVTFRQHRPTYKITI
ncbi:hypothetical protein [Jeotgalicoccus halotolerans]|uniref:hypothetical protein n=1 Tax=Jeotgalicoccus halotolerans TaxID=157227 RepID=UPI0013BEAB59|nr:hypothetical protein [Jeotgalicoccus halotolerans]